MSVIYRKTLKGVEEIALRTHNLQLRLRVYLILVDGIKSTEKIQNLHSALSEVETVLRALYDEGYLQIVSDDSADVIIDKQVANSQAEHVQPNTNQFNAPQALSQPNNSFYSNTVQNNNTADNNAQFIQARENMIREMMILLGKDAEMVVGKIQRCENGMALFAMMMGLKKIITIYASSDKAEAFANKFSYVSVL